MKSCCDVEQGKPTRSHFHVGFLGNPNCGKSTLFNHLTGSRQRIGNWPGVTVDRKTGQFTFEGTSFDVVDLPGVYSLDNSARSLDEKITRDYILSGEPDVIVNIVDASNLERNLYLSGQLLEMQVPMVLAINMMDVAEQHQIRIDLDALSQAFGCPVVPLIASRNQGLRELERAMLDVARRGEPPSQNLPYLDVIETAVAQLLAEIPETDKDCCNVNCRWLAAQILDGDSGVHDIKAIGPGIFAHARILREKIQLELKEDMDILLADCRYGFARQVTERVVDRPETHLQNRSDRIDSIVLNRYLGIPIFLGVIYLMFLFTINLGGAFIDFFDITAGAVFVEGLGEILSALGTPAWLKVLIADGLGGGIQVVATFIPIIGFLYLFLSFLESSGYMMRAAFVVDRFMRSLGLPGKAFVPLIVGFGCNVPAIMATRTLENHRERIITVLMTPFMSCGARLSVYALFAAAFFPVGGQNVVFSLYVIGIVFAILTALTVKKTLLPGEASPFLMELPTYHLPTLRSLLLLTWSRLKGFITDAGKLIIIMVVIINFLNSLGTDGSFGNEDSKHSVLSAISRSITPVFEPIGIEEDNWPATVGIFTGLLAKEVVVGTLDAIYSQIDSAGDSADTVDTDEFSLVKRLQEAVVTIPTNLGEALSNLGDPLGLHVLESSHDQNLAAETQDVNTATFGAMVKRFDGQAGAYAYLLFILLYAPCVAATAAIYREAGRRWMLYAMIWTTTMAYSAATIFYQLARFEQHPLVSSLWILGLALLIGSAIGIMRHYGKQVHLHQAVHTS
ncbi:MAG: Fe(2+) transporter permease subunit FeoB [Gammaproteobacteria bacterium]|nr:MAG: Fe(2+) transporter permease subunit FeoB [Gammaproteobacteria bacterium]